MQSFPSAASRRFTPLSGDSRRSCFVARNLNLRHKSSVVSAACRVCLRPHTQVCAARRDRTTYERDAASRITALTQNLYASRTLTQTIGTDTQVITELYQVPFSWSAAYDSRGRLTGFNRLGSEQSYSYDANSNRLTSIAKKISDTDIDGVFEATDRAATTAQALNIEASSNKLLGFNQSVVTQATAANGTGRTLSNVITAVNYQLDANGNLVSDGLRTFEYNTENRLAQVNITKDFEAAKITYLHNAAGQRVFKSEPQTAQTLPDEQTLGTGFVDWLRRNFQWLYASAQTNASIGTAYSFADQSLPSWALLGEYDNGSASGAGRVEYIWLPQEDGNAIPMAMFRGSRYFNIHSDHLGTPRLIKDDSAKPTWQWAYSAFGDNKPTGILKATTNPNAAITNQPNLLQATGAMEFNLRFHGQYLDQETGQFYNYYRTYMPNQGRYTQNDPIGLDGGANRFGYVEGNPLSLLDPYGLTPPFGVPGAIAGGVIGAIGGASGAYVNGQSMTQGAILGGIGGALVGGLGAPLGSTLAAQVTSRVAAGGIGNILGQGQGIGSGQFSGFNVGSIAGSAIGGALGATVAPATYGTSFASFGASWSSQLAPRAIAGIPGAAYSFTGNVVGTQVCK